jgi:hypothetical protein
MMKLCCALLALIPCLAVAVERSPFDGTWKLHLDAARFSNKPLTAVIAGGRYRCASCVPAIEVPADGADQAVSGHAYFDTVAVQPLSETSYRVLSKKAGKVVYDDRYAVCAAGDELRLDFIDRSAVKAVTGVILMKRAGAVPAAAHAASGSWQIGKIESLSDNGATVSFVATVDGLKMSTPAGRLYQAKFDGRPVPERGDAGHTLIALMRLNARAFERTDRRDGIIVGRSLYSVSADGNTLTVTEHDTEHNRTDMFVLDRIGGAAARGVASLREPTPRRDP